MRSLVAVVLLFAVACGGESDFGPIESPGSGGSVGSGGQAEGAGGQASVDPICEPGRRVSCPCEGPEGWQRCAPDGSSWDECVCPAVGSGGTDAAGGAGYGSGGEESSGGEPGASGGTNSAGGAFSSGGSASGGESGSGGASCSAVFYRDADEDGFGDPENSVTACYRPSGYVDNKEDCYDGNAEARPRETASWFSEDRGDGSFDYDCDTQETGEYDPFSGMCSNVSARTGWWDVTESPSCGEQGKLMNVEEGSFACGFLQEKAQRCR